MTAKTTGYAMSIKLNLPYEQAIEKVTAGLKEQGFGVLTEIDVKNTLKEKLGVEYRKYAILGACNPPLAHQALNTQLDIGLLLPCNVIVYEQDGSSVVSILDPVSMLGVMNNPALDPVSKEARSRLLKVIETLRD